MASQTSANQSSRSARQRPGSSGEAAAARITSPGSSTSRPMVTTSTSGASTSRRTSFGGSTVNPPL